MRALLAAILGASLVGCSTPPGTERIEARSSPIVGGEPTPPCAFPTTVAYRGRATSCTATLVHEKPITIAKHCVEEDTPVDIVFGDTPLMPARRVAIASCKGNDLFDFAYCLLAEEVTDVPIVPILYGCEKQVIIIGAKVVLVGFGLIGPNTPSPNSQKRWVETEIVDILPTSLVVGDATHGACFGDSGGPAYVKLADESWRVWGVTHGGLEGATCGTQTDYLYAPAFVEWIEQQSGLDVTPCYDATGVWNPGPKCTGFPTNPEVSDGTWARMCTENLVLSGPSAACGDPIDAGIAVPGTGGTGPIGAGGASTVGSGATTAGAGPAADTSTNVDGGCSCRIRQAPHRRRSLFLVLSFALAVLTSLSRLRRRCIGSMAGKYASHTPPTSPPRPTGSLVSWTRCIG